ncbi:unnamed protein product [Rotaria sp. Silwood2]|nr:unnamed protein product [Rotaria sp. Silwood2]
MGAGDSVINSGLTITLADRPTDNAFYWTGERVEGILDFDLLSHLPPSLPADSPLEPCVQYFLCVTSKRNSLHRNNYKSIPLTLSPRLNVLHYPHYSLELENKNRKAVHLHAIISQNFIVPGANLSIQYDLRNPKRSMTDRIEVRLVQYRQMSSCGTVQKAIVEIDVPYIRKSREEYLEGTFNLKIPDIYLPPTWLHPSSSSELGLNSNIVWVKYELTMTVK